MSFVFAELKKTYCCTGAEATTPIFKVRKTSKQRMIHHFYSVGIDQ